MANEPGNTPKEEQRAQMIPLSKIHDLPGVFIPKPPENKLGSMVLSIQNSGVMEPVILRSRGDGEYQLLSGYRRRRASELAQKQDIPALVYEMTMQEAVAYLKVVKEKPETPVPGKLVVPNTDVKGGETPAVEGKENLQTKPDAAGKQDNPDKSVNAAKAIKDKGDKATASPDSKKPPPEAKEAPAADNKKPESTEKDCKGQPAEAATPEKDAKKPPAEKKDEVEHKPAAENKSPTPKDKPKGTLRPADTTTEKAKNNAPEKEPEAPALTAAVKGSASTAINEVLEDRLEPPDETSIKSLPIPEEGKSIFVTLHPAYLEKSPLNTFSVDTNSENFKELCKSIELVGIKDPVLARFNAEGKLEILSGQRRHLAAKMLNRAVPTIIQRIDDADAKILVADGNLHRDKISSYDLSRALRMKMEGMKQKAGRKKKGYSASELQSDAKLAQEMGMSVSKLNRIIHLSEAVKGVCDMVDDGSLTISVASEIAYLKPQTQESVLHLLDLGYKATNERITRMKKAEAGGRKLDEMAMRSILDDKDIAPKQPEPVKPAVPVNEPPVIPASPDVQGQASAPEAPTQGQSITQNGPTADTAASVSSEATEPDPFEGAQERPEVTKVILSGDRLRKYFPDVSMTPRAIEESIYSALEERRQRQLKEKQKPQILKR